MRRECLFADENTTIRQSEQGLFVQKVCVNDMRARFQ
jgi:hypothetical protein